MWENIDKKNQIYSVIILLETKVSFNALISINTKSGFISAKYTPKSEYIFVPLLYHFFFPFKQQTQRLFLNRIALTTCLNGWMDGETLIHNNTGNQKQGKTISDSHDFMPCQEAN